MTTNAGGTITRALARTERDDVHYAKVMPLVYDELSTLARSYLRRERAGHTLDTRALVHEAYARLVGQSGIKWQNRRHFFGIAAQHMRRILCDYARQHRAEKRGGGGKALHLSGLEDLLPGDPSGFNLDDVLTLDQVLSRLEKKDSLALEIVHLRCFIGLNMGEVSAETGIPTRTLSRKWRWIRAWLINELRVDESQPPL